MTDYIYSSDRIGILKAGRVGIVGRSYVVELIPSAMVAARADAAVSIDVNLVSEDDASRVITPIQGVGLNTDGAGKIVAFVLPINSATPPGLYRGQMIIPFQNPDIDGDPGHQEEFIHWDLRIKKLGQISKSQLDRLWEAVNTAIENRLAQKVSADAGTTFSTDGISMSFATFSELADFRRELGAERNFKRTGGIDQRRVVFGGWGL